MKIKLNTKSELGKRPLPSIEEENGELTKITFSTDKNNEILSISYEDSGMIVEINDDFIANQA